MDQDGDSRCEKQRHTEDPLHLAPNCHIFKDLRGSTQRALRALGHLVSGAKKGAAFGSRAGS